MTEILVGVILISILHALIPSHWLPLISLSRTLQWSQKETLNTTAILACAHILSTLLLGVVLSVLGYNLNHFFNGLVEKLGPTFLIFFGIFFIYRHHKHKHFHIDDDLIDGTKTKKQVVYALMTFMFISPCLEIESYFFAAAPHGFGFVGLCALVYSVISLAGMLIWVYFALHGLKHINWHKLDHNAGLISGTVMVITGCLGLISHF